MSCLNFKRILLTGFSLVFRNIKSKLAPVVIDSINGSINLRAYAPAPMIAALKSNLAFTGMNQGRPQTDVTAKPERMAVLIPATTLSAVL